MSDSSRPGVIQSTFEGGLGGTIVVMSGLRRRQGNRPMYHQSTVGKRVYDDLGVLETETGKGDTPSCVYVNNDTSLSHGSLFDPSYR